MLAQIRVEVEKMLEGRDPAHDFEHVMRVYRNARRIAKYERAADTEVLLAAALMHDLVVYPKGSAKRSKSSDDSADLSEEILRRLGCPREKIEKISYCIRTHSYSKKIVPATIEGRILQDADRLDALGAIGVARTFSVGGTERRMFYNPSDPFGKTKRAHDERMWTLDHYKTKLLGLRDSMHTAAAKKIATKRLKFMKLYLAELKKEIQE